MQVTPPDGAAPPVARRGPAGPLFDTVHRGLSGHDDYRRFRAGTLPRADFARFLDSVADELVSLGVPAEDVHFAKRYPSSIMAFVNDALSDLVRRGVIARADFDQRRLAAVEASAARFDHHGLRTYIYPEEARLIFALAEIVKPCRALFLGSYYGYWAHWVLPAVVDAGGRAVLVDPDPRVQEVARASLADARISEAVELAVTTGERFLAEARDEFDFVVLDAEGPRDHPNPEQRGKRVYRPLLEHALPRLAPRALLVCHNILFSDHSGDGFFASVIERNRDELGPFLAVVEREFDGFVEYPSTEGVGVGWRRGVRARPTAP
jgi:predicted O-methyltransferase YrrM